MSGAELIAAERQRQIERETESGGWYSDLTEIAKLGDPGRGALTNVEWL